MIRFLRATNSYNFATTSKTVQQLFKSRSLFYQSTSEDINKAEFLQKYSNKSVYCGYDPTSDSLHLGNLVSIIMMGRLSLMGLKPIFLVGGATGLIGDPSGKSKERSLLEENIVNGNIESIQKEITKIYTSLQNDLSKNAQQYQINKQSIDLSLKNSFKLKNNYDFYKNLDAIRYLRDVGKYFRMGPLLSRETVANRLSSEQGISYAQFSYSIIQAYDFYRLYEQENCILQFGGSDQWGNITNGCELVRKKISREVYGITMPLLLTKSGHKFGKSQGNALFLNSQKTSLQEIHKYLYNSSDDQVQKYLRIFTFYSQNKIDAIMKEHQTKKQSRLAQTILSQSVLRYLGQFTNKNKQFFTLNHQQLMLKDRPFFDQLFKAMKIKGNQYYQIQSPLEISTITELLMKYQLAKSKSQVKRQIQKGGFYVNNKKFQLPDLNVPLPQFLKSNLIYNQYILLRWGKKKYQFLHFTK